MKFPEHMCPDCRTKLNAVSGVGKDEETQQRAFAGIPEEGDATICVKCGCLMIFKKDMTVRKADDKEIESLMKDWRVRAVMGAISKMKEMQ